MDSTEFSWNRFTEVDKSFSARATIRQNGQIGLNEGARNLYGISAYSGVVLFFDPDRRAIGFMFTSDEQEVGWMKFKADPKNSYINASNFLDRHGIDYNQSSRYELGKTNSILFIELDHPLGSGEVDPDKNTSAPEQGADVHESFRDQ